MKTYIADVVYNLPNGVYRESIEGVTELTYADGEKVYTRSVEHFINEQVDSRFIYKLFTVEGVYLFRQVNLVLSINFR